MSYYNLSNLYRVNPKTVHDAHCHNRSYVYGALLDGSSTRRVIDNRTKQSLALMESRASGFVLAPIERRVSNPCWFGGMFDLSNIVPDESQWRGLSISQLCDGLVWSHRDSASVTAQNDNIKQAIQFTADDATDLNVLAYHMVQALTR